MRANEWIFLATDWLSDWLKQWLLFFIRLWRKWPQLRGLSFQFNNLCLCINTFTLPDSIPSRSVDTMQILNQYLVLEKTCKLKNVQVKEWVFRSAFVIHTYKSWHTEKYFFSAKASSKNGFRNKLFVPGLFIQLKIFIFFS